MARVRTSFKNPEACGPKVAKIAGLRAVNFQNSLWRRSCFCHAKITKVVFAVWKMPPKKMAGFWDSSQRLA